MGAEQLGCCFGDAVDRGCERPLLAEAIDERDGLDAVAGAVEDLPGDGGGRHTDLVGELGDSAHHLALERLLVEKPLSGDDEICPLDDRGELELIGNEIEPRNELRASGSKAAGKPTCCSNWP